MTTAAGWSWSLIVIRSRLRAACRTSDCRGGTTAARGIDSAMSSVCPTRPTDLLFVNALTGGADQAADRDPGVVDWSRPGRQAERGRATLRSGPRCECRTGRTNRPWSKHRRRAALVGPQCRMTVHLVSSLTVTNVTAGTCPGGGAVEAGLEAVPFLSAAKRTNLHRVPARPGSPFRAR